MDPAVRRQRVLVMPQFNEERTVVAVLAQASAHVDRVVIVDDGSRDASPRLIRQWMETAPVAVDFLQHPRNRGMSGALLTGFCHVVALLAAGELGPDDVVITIDADGQHDPAEIPSLVSYMGEVGVDVALGRRNLAGYPTYKRIGNRLLSAWASLLSSCPYGDVECGFRAMRAAALPELLRYFSGFKYGCAQEIGVILPRLGFRVDNRLPVAVRYYRQGARFRDGLINAFMGFWAFLRVLLGMALDPYARSRAHLHNVRLDRIAPERSA